MRILDGVRAPPYPQGQHELQPQQAKEIAKLAGSRLSDDLQDYFLQAFEQTASKGQRKRERVTAP